jgi:phosphatidylglycerol---prolipoprotein diacylglyceryl transferase
VLGYYVHNLPSGIPIWGEFQIRFYGLAYVAGFWLAYEGLKRFRRRGWSELSVDQTAALMTWLVLGTLVGGRVAYCLLYDWGITLADPVSVIAFWRGGIHGMASHGGMAGVLLAAWWFSKRHGVRFWNLMDNLAVLAPIGIFFGRVANFINGELWGRPSDVPWAVVFPAAPWVGGRVVPRHPSQLYEALAEGLLLFCVMFWHRGRRQGEGTTAALFLIVYAAARITCEFFRQPDWQIAQGGFYWGWVTQGQLLSLLLLAAGGAMWVAFTRAAGIPKKS